MVKKIFFCLSLIWLTSLLLAASPAMASQFAIDQQIEYRLLDKGHLQVNHQVQITNLTTEKYPQFFQLQFSRQQITDFSARTSSGQELEWQLLDQSPQRLIKINLPVVVGKGKRLQFNINYTVLPDQPEGSVEFVLPKIQPVSDQGQIEVSLLLPLDLAAQTSISPSASRIDRSDPQLVRYYLPVDQLQQQGARVVLADNQVYDLWIRFTLQDMVEYQNQPAVFLPPDTAYQQVAILELQPRPDQIVVDPDGNWLALYPTRAKQINLSAKVRVYRKPVTASPRPRLITPSDSYWQLNQDINLEVDASQSAQAAYQWVVNQLAYNYDKVNSGNNRLGAQAALSTPEFANCQEFTDLAIALWLKQGIPARRSVGLAFSDDPYIRPLSLLADTLHTWPEYWDEQINNWHPTDPTWQSTTGGVDYFSIWDLRHITWVINQSDSQYPPVPIRSQTGAKQVNLQPGDDFPVSQFRMNISPRVPWLNLPYVWLKLKFDISNPEVLASVPLEIVWPDSPDWQVQTERVQLSSLPPQAEQTIEFRARSASWLLPDQIELSINGQTTVLKLPWGYKIIRLVNWLFLLLINAIVAVGLIKLARRHWGVSVQRQ